jgi:hypothetical protein
MAKGLCLLLGLAALLLLIPTLVLGWNFDYEVYGNILVSPARYNYGGFTSGGDGVFEFTLDDTGWPTDPTLRFYHIWDNYFAANYDSTTPGAYKWVGEFPGVFYMEVSSAPYPYNGWTHGTINAKITVRDFDEDQVLDPAEKLGEHLFDARLTKLCDHSSGGEMALNWGFGACNSNYFSFKMPPAMDTLWNGGNLNLMFPCPVASKETNWGSIKALYR